MAATLVRSVSKRKAARSSRRRKGVLLDRLSGRPPEHFVEVGGRQAGRRGQRRSRQVGAEVELDVQQSREYVVQAAVLRPRWGSGGRLRQSRQASEIPAGSAG